MLLARLAKLSSVSTDRIFKDAAPEDQPSTQHNNPLLIKFIYCRICYKVPVSRSSGGAAFMTPEQ